MTKTEAIIQALALLGFKEERPNSKHRVFSKPLWLQTLSRNIGQPMSALLLIYVGKSAGFREGRNATESRGIDPDTRIKLWQKYFNQLHPGKEVTLWKS